MFHNFISKIYVIGSWGNRATPASPMALGDSIRTHPIVGLSPYQNKWVIKARVTSKSPVRSWSNARGEGKLFSIDLTDESGEIRATAFKEQCDKFYDMLEVNQISFILPTLISFLPYHTLCFN